MGTIDITEAVDRIRLNIADYSDPEILDDNTIQYYLDKNSANEITTTKECAMLILGALSRQGRVRLDRLELHGTDSFNSYLLYIKEVIKSPTGAFSGGAGIYAGGVLKSDYLDNLNDADVIQKHIPTSDHYCEELFYDTTYGV